MEQNEIEIMIETVRNALAPKYEFPYYALVRIHTKHYGTIHIPAPFFNGGECNPRSQWAGDLPVASEKRNGKYYKCPICGETSYYAGVCQDCRRNYEIWVEYPENEYQGSWEEGPLPLEYRNHEALKASVKNEILYRIDHRIPDLGIISAEIVLSEPPSNVCGENHSPFMKSSSWESQNALRDLHSMIEYYTRGKKDEIHYSENDEIIFVPGSDERKVYKNGTWYHKHGATESKPENNYDYWHPMARIHKVKEVK